MKTELSEFELIFFLTLNKTLRIWGCWENQLCLQQWSRAALVPFWAVCWGLLRLCIRRNSWQVRIGGPRLARYPAMHRQLVTKPHGDTVPLPVKWSGWKKVSKTTFYLCNSLPVWTGFGSVHPVQDELWAVDRPLSRGITVSNVGTAFMSKLYHMVTIFFHKKCSFVMKA